MQPGASLCWFQCRYSRDAMEPPEIFGRSFSYRKLLSQARFFGHNPITLSCLMKYKFEAYFLKLCEGRSSFLQLLVSSAYSVLMSLPSCYLPTIHCFLPHQTTLCHRIMWIHSFSVCINDNFRSSKLTDSCYDNLCYRDGIDHI